MRRGNGAGLDDLNPEQRRAVTTTEGPVLVLAGAGSGKTRVITRRIAHLLSKGVEPRAILAVTFTNKAAREMRERVAALVGAESSKLLTVCTFHAFCVRVLREHGARVGLDPRFTICDASDQLAAVKGALRELRIAEAAVHPKAALSLISLMKNRLVSVAEAEKKAVDDRDELVARAYRGYEAALRRSKVVDFDDLLLRTRELLEKHDDVRRRYEERYRYVMVDEYQDTNGPQYEILRLVAGKRRNVCVVGDDDQSIYGWRGADVRKILNFERDFKGATAVRLETNYRSTEAILAAANAVIRNNRARHEKTLQATGGPGDPVRVFETEDEEHESELIVDEIAHEVRQGRARYGDYAILFRTAMQPRPFEARLRAARIPYDLVGGLSFFDRKEVRDVVAFLRLASNPDDEASLLRVINVPPRGVGNTTVERVLEIATKQGVSAGAVFDGQASLDGVSAEAIAVVRRFRATLAGVRARVSAVGLVQAVRGMLLAVNYPAEVERLYADPVARQTRWAAVEEVLNLAENYVRRTAGPSFAGGPSQDPLRASEGKPSLEGFLEEVALSAEEPEEEPDDGRAKDVVTLMTLHAAKGLEFPRVYIAGVEEGLLPHERSIAEDTVEEERRLMYVGITRARRHLTLTRAKTRATYGQRAPKKPSRFLYEMRSEKVPFEVQSPRSPVPRQDVRKRKAGAKAKR